MSNIKYPLIQVGDRFTRWVVLEAAKVPQGGRMYSGWLCQCDCGTRRAVKDANLKKGGSRSCGCLRLERSVESARKRMTIHGESKTSPEWFAWTRMIVRCYYPSHDKYKYYGGAGVVVCDSWRNSYPAFLEDMGRMPGLGYSPDRYPNKKGNYEPGNVRWATKEEQANNKISNHLVTIGGETLSIAQWTRKAGKRKGLIGRRIALGWPPERLLEPTGAPWKTHRQ